MLNAFSQSVKALKANPVRTGLTTLGIVIGISTVILVLSAGEGFRSLINSQLEAYGTNTLFIQTRVPPTTKNKGAGASSADQSRAASPVAITTLKTRDLDDIKKLPNVVNTYGMVVGQKVVSYRGTEKSVLFYATSAARFDIDKGKLKEGRFFTQAEDTGADQVVILGSSLASDLFGQQDPLNELIRIGDINFSVIGVYEPRGGLGGDEDNTVYLPLRTGQKKLLGIDHLLMAVVQVRDSNLGEATAEDIRFVLRRNHNTDENNPDKDDFVVQTQADALGTFNTLFCKFY
jgi:ABC-type antimicrobial peptide transport system permease subunit